MECAQLAAAFVSAPEFDRGGSAALCSLRRLRPVLWLRLRRAVYFAVCPAPDSSGSTSRQLRIAPDSSGQHDQESGPTRAYPDLSGPIRTYRAKKFFPAQSPGQIRSTNGKVLDPSLSTTPSPQFPSLTYGGSPHYLRTSCMAPAGSGVARGFGPARSSFMPNRNRMGLFRRMPNS